MQTYACRHYSSAYTYPLQHLLAELHTSPSVAPALTASMVEVLNRSMACCTWFSVTSTWSCMRARDSLIRTTASSCRTVIGTAGISPPPFCVFVRTCMQAHFSNTGHYDSQRLYCANSHAVASTRHQSVQVCVLFQAPSSSTCMCVSVASIMPSNVHVCTSSLISTYSVTSVVAARCVRRGEHFTREYSR